MQTFGRAIPKGALGAWVLVIVCAIVIFVASAKSGHDLNSGDGLLSMVAIWLKACLSEMAGKPVDPSPIGHFIEYFVFGIALANALRFLVRATGRTSDGAHDWDAARGRAVVGIAVALAAVYAVTDELHQLFVPGRACDPADFAVDVVAALLGATVFWLAGRWRMRRRAQISCGSLPR